MLEAIQIRQISAAFLARVFLGLLFFLQGYDKVFRIKVKNVIDTIHTPLESRGVPAFFSVMGAYGTSYVELICGAALIAGFATYWSLYLLGIDMLFAALVFGIVEPVWDMKHIFPRLTLLVFLLIAPSQWNVLSVDYIWSLIRFLRSI